MIKLNDLKIAALRAHLERIIEELAAKRCDLTVEKFEHSAIFEAFNEGSNEAGALILGLGPP